LTWLGNSRKY